MTITLEELKRKRGLTDKKEHKEASIEAQKELLSILNDSPEIVEVGNKKYNIRSPRFGTQYLIAESVMNITDPESGSFKDIVQKFRDDIPSMVKIITLCILNDVDKIYKDGDESKGFSDEYVNQYNEIMWGFNLSQCLPVLIKCLQMIDISNFYQALDMLQIFRASVTKRMEAKTQR